jgi:hypothetical protein
LAQYLFVNVREAQDVLDHWRDEYNHYRPHSSLNYLTPAEFAAQHPEPLLAQDWPQSRDAALSSPLTGPASRANRPIRVPAAQIVDQPST